MINVVDYYRTIDLSRGANERRFNNSKKSSSKNNTNEGSDPIVSIGNEVSKITKSIMSLKSTINNLCCGLDSNSSEIAEYEDKLMQLELLRNEKISDLNNLLKYGNEVDVNLCM